MGFFASANRLSLALLPLLAACGEPGSPPTGEAGPAATTPAPTHDGPRTAAPDLTGIETLDPAAVAALRDAAQAVDRAPDSVTAWNDLATRLHAHQRLDQARTCYLEVLRRAPDDPRATYRLALVDEELGREQESLERLERGATLASDYAPAHWRLGLARLDRGELERAEAELRRALAIAPDDAAATVGLARVQLARGQDAEAAAGLEAHLARHAQDGNARFLLGTAYRKLGRTEEAQRALAAGAGGEPLQDDPWLAEVMALRAGQRTEFLAALEDLERGDVQEATRALEALRTQDPGDSLVLINLHRAYRMAGRLDEALAMLEQARELDPSQDIVHLHLAGALREKARRGGGAPDPSLLALALESARQAIALSPTFSAAHGMLGDVLLDLGRHEEATAAWSEAARLDRADAMWQERAGQALCLLGRWSEAVPFLRQWDALRPNTPQALLLLSAALANSGQLADARTQMQRLRRIAPDDPTVEEAWRKLEDEWLASGGR